MRFPSICASRAQGSIQVAITRGANSAFDHLARSGSHHSASHHASGRGASHHPGATAASRNEKFAQRLVVRVGEARHLGGIETTIIRWDFVELARILDIPPIAPAHESDKDIVAGPRTDKARGAFGQRYVEAIAASTVPEDRARGICWIGRLRKKGADRGRRRICRPRRRLVRASGD
jgi:hypothetical protein